MNISRWVLPCLTALAVAASVLLPERLSRMADRKLMDRVHAVPMATEDASAQSLLSRKERLELLARNSYSAAKLSAYSQRLQPGDRQLEDCQALFLEELQALAEDGIFPESLLPEEWALQGERLFLRDTATGAAADFWLLTATGTATGAEVRMDLDGTEGRALLLEISTPELSKHLDRQKISALVLGERFLNRLSLEYTVAWEDRGMADFFLEDGMDYVTILDKTSLAIAMSDFTDSKTTASAAK